METDNVSEVKKQLDKLVDSMDNQLIELIYRVDSISNPVLEKITKELHDGTKVDSSK